MMEKMIKTYSELVTLTEFLERFEYLKLKGVVGDTIFGGSRFLNQTLYRSREWRRTRDLVIIRDNACDLAHPDYEILNNSVTIHHINPLTIDQVSNSDPIIFDLEFLVCVSNDTHRAIHYGTTELLPKAPIARYAGDTCPWR